jgi:putative nucleotidyltransferase with HDIG domain
MRQFLPPAPQQSLIVSLADIARAAGLDAYVVGGTVRDVLLGRDTRDLDLAIDGDALGWARALADRLGGHFVLLDDINAVARVVLDGNAGAAYIDVAAIQGSLEDDMRRRDFTVDALAVPLGDARVIDPCGGIADLDARTVRMNGAYVFDADPLRLLRAVRIAAELRFDIDPATADAIRERAPRVEACAAERRRDELARIFALDAAYPALRQLDDLGLLDALFPELSAGRGVTQPEQHHAYDVFEHNLRAVEAADVMLALQPPAGGMSWLHTELWRAFAWCEPDLRAYLAEEMSEGRSRAVLLKLAALLHDVAKPQTRTEEPGGRARFFGHADLGAGMARQIMRRLRFSSRESAFVALLVAEHLRPIQLAQIGEAPTRRALYRFYRDLGDAVPAVLLLALADAAAARGGQMTRDGWSRQVAYMNSLLVRSREEEGIVHPPRLLSGRDIMSELELPAGPAIGRLLAAIEEAQAAGDVHDRKGALAFARKLAREGAAGR